MVDVKDFGNYETQWCPGCGNFSILKALKRALAESGIEPHRAVLVSGIGQAAKAPHYLTCNVFNGLHGRGLPAATGIKLANPELEVVYESGDGCTYGEGGNHFLAALRRNIGITMFVHDNQIYGLTKGQASPTSDEGFRTKAQPGGVALEPFNPVLVAVALQANFVARSFSGNIDFTVEMMKAALAAEGLALLDILQPCVTFNKVNTFRWYRDRVKQISSEHDPTDWAAAMKIAAEWGELIPVGVIYRGHRPAFEASFSALEAGPLVGRAPDRAALGELMDSYRLTVGETGKR